jgi:NAD(P)-dependent dehydrogenase (short-subunit alcohol dehydrogenase family)
MTPKPQNPGPMAGKTVLITGGTGGIGKATAIGLASVGARVGITGRDGARARAAAADISRESGNPAVDAYPADLSSQTEVRRLAAAVLDAYPRLDVLVNHVGGFWAHRHVTADGLEHTFAVNHLASFLLTDLLLDRLTESTRARIVTVSSNAQALGRINFDDLQGARDYSGSRAYNQSKLAVVMFTYELSRRLHGTTVTANALHPGVVHTAFSSEDPSALARAARPLMRFMKTPAQGAATSIYLARHRTSRKSPASTSPTANPNPRTRPPTTPSRRTGSGRSAPTRSASPRLNPAKPVLRWGADEPARKGVPMVRRGRHPTKGPSFWLIAV